MHVINTAKRTALSRLLLETVTSTAPGEMLEEKLAGLSFSAGTDERKHVSYSYTHVYTLTLSCSSPA